MILCIKYMDVLAGGYVANDCIPDMIVMYQ